MPSYTASQPQARPDYVEAGDYEIEVIDAEETISKKGNPLIELKLRIHPSGALCFDNLVFTEAAFWKIDSFRLATGEVVTPGEEVEIEPDNLIGRTARARLIVEEYNGRKRNKVAAWLAPENGSSAKKGGSGDGNPF